MKTIINWALLAFFIYLLVQFPDDMSRLFSDAIDLIGRSVESLGDFANGVING